MDSNVKVNGKIDATSNLEKLIEEVQELRTTHQLRKPVLIEFSGSPKSGKTTCIRAIEHLLKKNGFNTMILDEKGSICPVHKKTHAAFNIWTLCSSLSELLKSIHSQNEDIEFILADRLLFDSLCWFDWLKNNPSESVAYLDDKSYTTLQQFVIMDDFIKMIDLVCVFFTEPKTSIERDKSLLLTSKKGSIMNNEVLSGHYESLKRTVKNYRKVFKKVDCFYTTDEEHKKIALEVTGEILSVYKDLLLEKIGFFNDAIKTDLKPGINDVSLLEGKKLEYKDRKVIEKSDKIQPIPIVVITNHVRKKVLVLKKSKKALSSDSPERDKILLYAGGHVREEDKYEVDCQKLDKRELSDLSKIFLNTLMREIKEELDESIAIKNTDDPFLIYVTDVERSKKHLAICYVIEMNLENKQFTPANYEFENNGKSCKVMKLEELEVCKEELDTWSKYILSRVFS